MLVKKRGGSVRVCIDYRSRNAVRVKDVNPLLCIDEILESFGCECLFSTLGLHVGYWQVEVADADKDKSVLTTRQRLFSLARMSFGLANAPETFQRLMDSVLRGLLWAC